ncbi:unnamed protein product, partial [Effrenium voratum]
VLYHPLNYKVSLCKGCKAYYCPFAHGADLRQAAEVKAILANSEEEEEDVDFHRFDDRLRILREDWAGGSSRGLRGEIWEKSAWRSCLVRTIHYTRAQRKEELYTNELVKSIKDMREKREELNCQILEEEEDKTNIRKELSPFSAVACRRRTWGASSPSRRCPTRSSATDALDFLSESEE